MGTGRKGFYLYKDSTLGRDTQVPCWRRQRGYSKIKFNGRHFSLKHREKTQTDIARAQPCRGGRRWEPEHSTKREFLHWFHRTQHSLVLLHSGGIQSCGPALRLGFGSSLGRAALSLAAPSLAAPHPTPQLLAVHPPENLQGCSALPEGHIQAHSLEKN